MDSETRLAAGAGPPAIPDRIGTPGTTGVIEEGGRLVRAGPAEAAESPEAMERPGPLGTDTAPTLALRAEELRPRTRRVPAGEVVLRTRVVTEKRLLEVEIRREELVIERRAFAAGPPEDALPRGAAEGVVHELRDGETLTILLREEDIRLQKVPVVAEEVRVSKRLVEETRPITASVRREELRVDREGGVTVHNAGDAAPAG